MCSLLACLVCCVLFVVVCCVLCDACSLVAVRRFSLLVVC